MAEERGWHLAMYFNPESTRGFILVDREVRGARPDRRAWAERFISDTRLAQALRAEGHEPDCMQSTRYLKDGSKPEDTTWFREEAETQFLKIIQVLKSKGALVKLNDRAAKFVEGRGDA